MTERYHGFTATGSGSAHLRLAFPSPDTAIVSFRSQWMGDDAPLEVTLRCTHNPRTDRSGELVLRDAGPNPLPESDGELVLEYLRTPTQPSGEPGSGIMAMVGAWNETFDLLLWLHRDAVYDPGDQLEPDEYAHPPEAFLPVARTLAWLRAPWKLARED